MTETILSRFPQSLSTHSPQLTASQARADALVSSFVDHATDGYALAGMVGGGLVYRLGHVGPLALGSRLLGESAGVLPSLIRYGSVGVAFTGEVFAFEAGQRALRVGIGGADPALLRWSGENGLARGLVGAAITLGSLKGTGAFVNGQNPVLRHLFQDSAMVLAHHVSGTIGITDRPRESLAEQMVNAEATLWQMNAGMALVHGAFPGLGAAERSLDLDLRARERFYRFSSRPSATQGLQVAFPEGISLDGRWFSISLEEPGRPSVQLSQMSGPVDAPASARTGDLNPAELRFFFPKDPYFEEMYREGSVTLDVLAGGARAKDRTQTVGNNLRITLLTPMSPRHEYSPDGAEAVAEGRAAVLEAAKETDPAAMARALDHADEFTGRSEWAVVVTPGRAILGMNSAPVVNGRVVARVAAPIMGGKAKFFIRTAGVNTFDLPIECELTPSQMAALEEMEPRRRQRQQDIWLAGDFVRKVRAIAHRFRFINVEDAQGVDLPIILEGLKDVGAAVWSDDKQGTGVIAATAFLSWAHLTGRDMSRVRGVIFGAGAGAMGVYDELLLQGIRPENILVTDSGPNKDRNGTPHSLDAGRADIADDPFKVRMSEGIPAGTSVEEFARDADFVINLGDKKTFTRDWDWTTRLLQNLQPDALVLPMTNPDPGLYPHMLAQILPGAYYGSGNMRFPNPVNNFCAFGQVGLGVIMSQARGVGPNMTVGASRGMFELVKSDWERMDPEQRRFYLVPRPDDPRLPRFEALAVAKAAARDGLSTLIGPNPSAEDLAEYDRRMEEEMRFREEYLAFVNERIREDGDRYYRMRYGNRYAPFSLRDGEENVYNVAPLIRRDHFEYLARQLGLREEAWRHLVEDDGRLKPTALIIALNTLRPAAQGSSTEAILRYKELRMIVDLAAVSPTLGLALAVEAAERYRPGGYVAGNLSQTGGIETLVLEPTAPPPADTAPTIFHRPQVLGTVLQLIPEAERDIAGTFEGIPQRATGSH